jgi:hypothetical protein
MRSTTVIVSAINLILLVCHVDDGSGDLAIFVSTRPGIDLSGLDVGTLVTVAGFSGQFSDHYEVNPRFPADVIVLARA